MQARSLCPGLQRSVSTIARCEGSASSSPICLTFAVLPENSLCRWLDPEGEGSKANDMTVSLLGKSLRSWCREASVCGPRGERSAD
jgi:hypothetical protein